MTKKTLLLASLMSISFFAVKGMEKIFIHPGEDEQLKSGTLERNLYRMICTHIDPKKKGDEEFSQFLDALTHQVKTYPLNLNKHIKTKGQNGTSTVNEGLILIKTAYKESIIDNPQKQKSNASKEKALQRLIKVQEILKNCKPSVKKKISRNNDNTINNEKPKSTPFFTKGRLLIGSGVLALGATVLWKLFFEKEETKK